MKLTQFRMPRSVPAQLVLVVGLFALVPMVLAATGNLPKVNFSLSNNAPPPATPGMQLDLAQVLKLVKENPLQVRVQKTKDGTTWNIDSPSKKPADDKPSPQAIAEAIKYLEDVKVPDRMPAAATAEPIELAAQPAGIAAPIPAVPEIASQSAADVVFPPTPNASRETDASSRPGPSEAVADAATIDPGPRMTNAVSTRPLARGSAPAAAAKPASPRPVQQYYYGDYPRRRWFGR